MPILVTLALVLIAAGAGMAALRRLDCLPEGAVASFAWGAGLGLGMMAYGVQAIGLVGLLRQPILLGWVGLLFIAGLPSLWAWLRELPFALRAWRSDVAATGGAGALSVLFIVACLGLAVLTLPATLAPAGGMDWDSLSYHLAAPKIYLQRGAVSLIPYDSHTNFPFTMEMLYTLGLAWGGQGAAKLIHWSAGWLTALALAAWVGERAVGEDGEPRPWAGPLAAALFASIPLVMWEATTAYIDLGTALFQFLALASLFRAFAAEERSGAYRWLALAGIFSGLAMGTKYTALLQFGLLGLAVLVFARKSRDWRGVAAFGLAGVIVASPWYLRNWIWTNNPVYPFFIPLFPNSLNWDLGMHEAYQREQHSFGLGKGVANLGRALWDLGLHGRAFFIVQRSLAGDVLGSLGIGVAGLAPLVLLTRRVRREVWWLLAYLGGSVLLWFFLSQQARYLMPVWAAGCAAGALTLAALRTKLMRSLALAFVTATIALQAWLFWPAVGTAWQLATGSITREGYRERSLPALSRAAEFVNGLPEGTALAMYQETRGFYFDVPYIWANPGQHNMIDYELMDGDGAVLATELRDRFGLTHVLTNRQFWGESDKTPWGRAVIDAIRRGEFQEVYRTSYSSSRPIIIYALQ